MTPVVPVRRQTTKRPSGLNQSSSADAPEPSYEGVSDSGYSSHSVASTSVTDTPPPPKAPTPAPTRTQQPSHRSSSSSSSNTIPPLRPRSKSFSRTASTAVPRNVPSSNTDNYGYQSGYGMGMGMGAVRREGGGSSDCDCADCGKAPKSKSSPIASSPSATSGAWPIHPQSSAPYLPSTAPYGQSPGYSGYQYPLNYDGYPAPADSAVSDSSVGETSRRKHRSSMPPPPRPQSTFAGSTTTTTSNHSSGSAPYGHSSSYSASGYFSLHPSPTQAPAAPAPSSTCPPAYGSSMYAPPPLNTSIPPSPQQQTYSSYVPPSIPSYPYMPTAEYYTAPSTPTASHGSSDYRTDYSADYSAMPPPPPIMNRRNSMRAPANVAAAIVDSPIDYTYQGPHPPQRRMSNNNRVHSGERPPSWYGVSQQAYQEVPERSYSVPPAHTSAPVESSRRRGTTPQPIRRRESNSQGSSGSHRLSALSRSMEACAISDDYAPRPTHHRHHSSHAVARREPGVMMQSSYSNRSSDSGSSSGHDGRDDLVQLSVPNSDLTMSYSAGVPLTLQLNGGAVQRILPFGRKSKNESVENGAAYRYVQQRQQQLHAQLKHGAGQYDHGDRRSSGEYHRRSSGEYHHRTGYSRA